MDWLNHEQLRSVDFNSMFMVMYLSTLILKKDMESTVCALALFASLAYSFSPLYNLTIENNPSLVFLVYACIYFTAIRFLTNRRVIAACFTMAIFEGLTYKAYLNEIGHHGIENWLYDSFEYITALLHTCIIGSLVNWSRLFTSCKRNYRRVLHYFRLYSTALPV